MKNLLILYSFLLVSCANNSNGNLDKSLKTDELNAIYFSNPAYKDSCTMLLFINNSKPYDIYIKCFKTSEKEIFRIVTRVQAYNKFNNSIEMKIKCSAPDTAIIVKSNSKRSFLFDADIKDSDTLFTETDYTYTLNGQTFKEYITQRFSINGMEIKLYSDPIDRLDRNSLINARRHPLSKELLDKIKTDSTLIANEVLARKSGSKISSPAK